MQDNETVMCEFYCIAFIENILSRKTLLDFFLIFNLSEWLWKEWQNNESWIKIKKNWWINELTFRWSKTQWFNEWKIQEDM